MPPRFQNWSGLHRSTPRRWISPSSEAELAEQLSRASREGRRVRAVGSGHSWSDVALPEDIALDLRKHAGVVSIDEQEPSIVVRAGTRLEEITRALDARGLAMPILGSIAKQTIAGAISTATHGSSLRHGNLASLVRRLRLVTPRGEILELDARDPRFDAARVSLGALGVITQVELGVTRAFRLMETREALPFHEVVRDLASIAASAEFVKLWWLPSTGKAVVFRYERTEEPERRSRLYELVDEKLVNRGAFELMLRFVGRYPRATSSMNALVAASYFGDGKRVAQSDRAFNLAMPPVHREAEWAYAMGDAPEALAELERFITRAGVRVNFPCEVRFVKADSMWLSPAYERDACHVGVYQAESPDLAVYFRGASELARRRAARPHWGKEFDWSADEIAAAYPRARDFAALRRELDPTGVLENAFVARVLGRVSGSA